MLRKPAGNLAYAQALFRETSDVVRNLGPFFAAYLLATLSPGPNVLLVVTHAMKSGYRAIFTAIAANLICQLGIVVAVAAGVGAVLTVDSLAFSVIKFLGAGYLVYLGARLIVATWRDRAAPLGPGARRDVRRPSIRRRFEEAFFIYARNPKTVVFLAAFPPRFVDPARALTRQLVQMFPTIAAIALAIHALYAWGAVYLKRRIVDRRMGRGASYASGGVFVALGAGLSAS